VSRVCRAGAFTLCALACAAAQVAAQQKPPDSIKTRMQIIQERLRSLRPLITDTAAARDSARVDSLRADSLQRAERAGATMSALPRDSMMSILAALGGYTLTEYKADTALFAADSSRLTLLRQAQVQREGQQIAADSTIIFDQNTSIACARGAPIVTSTAGEAPMRADSLCYNVDLKRAVGYGVTTEITEGANWIVHSNESFMVGDTLYSHNGIFTDCSLETPHYHFGAGELKYIGRDIIVARNVTFNFRDVPVFWFPFFVQSTKQGRRSGILTPQFGVNDIARTSAGYQRRISNVGFYWAISDHYGAELAMGWHAQNFTELRGTVDFRYLRQFLAGSMTYRNMWKSEGGTDRTISVNSDWQPDERTTLRADISYASSTQFIRQRSLDPRELNQSIRSGVGFSRRFNWSTFNLSGSRDQRINDGTVDMSIPVALTFPAVTLFAAAPGDAHWYNNLTWNGSARANRTTRDVKPENPNRSTRSRNEISGDVSSSFTVGRLGVSQSMSYRDATDLERTFPDTSLVLPERGERGINWNTGINFQQRLIGTSTITPGISLSGNMIQNDTLGADFIAAPTRINFNASLRTDLFKFLPGIASIERIRHRLSPSFSYTYSPSPVITQRQREVFRLTEIQEQNRLTIGLSQTFEGKPSAPEGQDTLTARPDSAGGPRRKPGVQPITLLSITTDAVVWDFVEAKKGFGVQTMEVGNNIQSDLLRGLQLSFAHDLFEERTDSTNTVVGREFKPHLSRLNASFSINADSWFARLLGLGRSQRQQQPTAQMGVTPQDTSAAPQVRESQGQFGLLGDGRQRDPRPEMGQGNWNVSVNYALSRPRGGLGLGGENQMVQLNMSLQPTAQWAVQWNTGYSFTNSEFTDHILTFTRQMHDWDANFDFVKAQNGNFSFQFRVQLRANPDIKLDYQQRELQNRVPTQF